MTLAVVVLLVFLIVVSASAVRRLVADDARRTIRQAHSARAAMRRAREESVRQLRSLDAEHPRRDADSRSA